MKRIIILVLILINIISGCSLKNEQTKEAKDALIEVVGDNDGDLMSNTEEELLGRDANIANIPELKVSFIQNYKVEVDYNSKVSDRLRKITFDTSVGNSDPSFKYRVGDIFIRNHSFNAAANVGKFSTHSWGEIQENDLTWINYPEVDPKFFHGKSFNIRGLFNENNYNIKNIKINLENSVKLRAYKGFSHIKNLELNFYYYNYETEHYELLKTHKVDRHFNSGINETFNIELDNVPAKLLKENYFKRGEFIITEVKDYEIPELGTTYKALLNSVRKKTIPLVFNTPLESKVFYVASGTNGKSFAKLLETVFSKNYKIVNNQLTRVGQFENNLSDFSYLKEIRKNDKKGKWFVLTNTYGKHFLDMKYTSKDYVSLSFLTGKQLASQTEEKIYSHSDPISGGTSFKVIPLGNIGPNSRVEFQILPMRIFGTEVEHFQEKVDFKTHSVGDNGVMFGLMCDWRINRLKDYNCMVNPHDSLIGPLEKVALVINGNEYSLHELHEQKKIKVSWESRGSDIRNGLHIIIDDITAIQAIANFDHNVLSLKISSQEDYVFNGIKLVDVGRIWEHRCAYRTFDKAIEYGIPVSSKSIHLDDFQFVYDHFSPEKKGKTFFKDNLYIYQQLEINVSSTIENYHN